MFFTAEKDLCELLEFVYANGGILIYEDGTEVEKSDWIHLPDEEYIEKKFRFYNWYIKLDNSYMKFGYAENIDRKSVDFFYSEVIKLSIPKWSRTVKDGYVNGRIWYEYRYYDENGELKDTKYLDSFYNKIKRYITKNYRISEDKYFYIAPEAYKLYKENKYVPLCNGGSRELHFD